MSGTGSPDFSLDASALKVAVIYSNWHEKVMEGLVAGAERALSETGCKQISFTLFLVHLNCHLLRQPSLKPMMR